MDGFCGTCRSSGEVELPKGDQLPGFLSCPFCGDCLTGIDISQYGDWIEARVQRKSEMQRQGRIGTRIQSTRQTDMDIDRDGMAAELAAACILCPTRIEAYMKIPAGQNRGRDLPRDLTGLPLPVEVKMTRYKTRDAGFLIVRPPRMTPGRMLASYLDPAIYVLMNGKPFGYECLGWIDRDRLVADGVLNPVPIRPGQRECWGIHWSKLSPLRELSSHATVTK